MTPKQLLKNIFATNYLSIEDEKIRLHSNIDENEGLFLTKIINKNNYSKSIEIGCAYGISSLFICDALQKSDSPRHYIIDPFQNTDWKGIGIENLKKCNIDFYKLIEKPSELALPELLAKGEKFDFAFIDGWHTFDHTLIDFFYVNRMLEVGGTIVIDDVGLESVNKLVRYVLNYPSYELSGAIIIDISKKKKVFNNLIINPLSFISKILPKKVRSKIFSNDFLYPDNTLGIQSSMVAIKKIKEDKREWYWFEPF